MAFLLSEEIDPAAIFTSSYQHYSLAHLMWQFYQIVRPDKVNEYSLSEWESLNTDPDWLYTLLRREKFDLFLSLIKHSGLSFIKTNVIGENLLCASMWPKSYNAELVASLVNQGLNIEDTNGDGRTVLASAAARSNIWAVKQLLDLGANVNVTDRFGVTPLHLSLIGFSPIEAKVEILNLLLSAGADVNALDQDGVPALFWAIKEGLSECAHLLVQHGAKVLGEGVSTKNKSYLEAALEARENNVDLVRVLIDAGVDVNQSNNKGEGALHWSLQDLHAMQFLLQAGCDPNHQDNKSQTALHHLVVGDVFYKEKHTAALLSLLLEAGANPYLQDNNGVSVISYAYEHRAEGAVGISKIIAWDEGEQIKNVTQNPWIPSKISRL